MIVEIKDLVKRYGEELALDHLSLKILPGEIFGLLGPNGAGKTTLINSMLGLTKVQGGEIRIFDKDLGIYYDRIKKEVGVVPQELALYEDLTAYENVELFAGLYGLRGTDKKEKVDEALAFVGLLERKKQFPKKFSGGMKRRLNIAMAIVHQPKLVIMDEPTVGIDPQSRNQILESVKTLNRRGITIIYTSHYMEEVEGIATNIGIMDKGRIIALGTNRALKELIDFEQRGSFTVEKPDSLLREAVERISGVSSTSLEEERLIVGWKKGTSPMGEIVKVITEQGYTLRGVTVKEPNLEQVFLTLTGKSLRDD
ncbi:ABC transporter ATP-binding protein [Isachenkonia alkalipeptolytica]|uniref:ABC transporter ATP-binding protein n=1 Tax=Isachenkonia alkalipeptolytica TaxID=2565777 RepID=A0AA43XHB0_9CLOT|nr:ABC transporter ATP-binding protein [Isachenkonia alkalipeptolytica]NBG86918.1 ABC transporter ATP-binding protein [Isachenkonia alkalipeptolytica]